MANAPAAIWKLWYAIRDQWKGGGQQDEVLAGIVGDRAHSFGFHLAPNELPTSDYSLRALRDRRGAALYPGDASALDVHFGPAGMITATKRLIASAKDPDDPRLDGLYEFCGTTTGTHPHPFTVDTGSDDPNNTQGWDDSHVSHVHLSIHRDVSHNFDALKGIADVIGGVPLAPPAPTTEPNWSDDMPLIVRVSKTDAARLKVRWPGIFLLHGALTHIATSADYAAYRAAKVPEVEVTIAEYHNLGGR